MSALRRAVEGWRRDADSRSKRLEVVLAGVLLVAALIVLHRSTRTGPAVALLRIQGETRVETAVAASRHWESPVTVVLVGVNAADDVLLRVAACAGELDAPLLLIPAGGPTPLVQARLEQLRAAQFVTWGHPEALGIPTARALDAAELCPARPAVGTRLLTVPRRLEAVLRPFAAEIPEQERGATRLVVAASTDRPGVPDAAVAVVLAQHLERDGELTPVAVALVDRGAEGELRPALQRLSTTVTGAVVVGGDAAVALRVREDVSRTMVAPDTSGRLAAFVGTLERLGNLALAALGLLAAAAAAAGVSHIVAPALSASLGTGRAGGPGWAAGVVASLRSEGPTSAAQGAAPLRAPADEAAETTSMLLRQVTGTLQAARTYRAAAAGLKAEQLSRVAVRMAELAERHDAAVLRYTAALRARTGSVPMPRAGGTWAADVAPAVFLDEAIAREEDLLHQAERLEAVVPGLALQQLQALGAASDLRQRLRDTDDGWPQFEASLRSGADEGSEDADVEVPSPLT